MEFADKRGKKKTVWEAMLEVEPHKLETDPKHLEAVTTSFDLQKNVRKDATDSMELENCTSNFQFCCYVCCAGMSRTREEQSLRTVWHGQCKSTQQNCQ